MNRWVFIVVGALMALFGTIWALQGLGYIGGSAMSGVTLWAVVGPIVAAVGLVLLILGVRRSRT